VAAHKQRPREARTFNKKYCGKDACDSKFGMARQ
jgi:hypothetical protein